jgi:hypothetical protein
VRYFERGSPAALAAYAGFRTLLLPVCSQGRRTFKRRPCAKTVVFVTLPALTETRPVDKDKTP